MSALPNPAAFAAASDEGGFQEGMTLRDWFAGQALPAIIAVTSAGQHQPGRPDDHDKSVTDRMVLDAYRLADAMLAARVQS